MTTVNRQRRNAGVLRLRASRSAQNDRFISSQNGGWLAGDGEGGLDGVGYAVGGVGGADWPVAGGGEEFEVRRGVRHEDGGAGDFEHGDVVPVVADGEDLRGGYAVRGGEREDGRAFGAAGGEDVEDGEVAGWVFGAVEGEEGDGFSGSGGIASHS